MNYKINYEMYKSVEEHNEGVPNRIHDDIRIDRGDVLYHENDFTRDNLAQFIVSCFKRCVDVSESDIQVCVMEDENFMFSLWEDGQGRPDECGRFYATYELGIVVSVIPDVSPLEKLNLATAKDFYN